MTTTTPEDSTSETVGETTTGSAEVEVSPVPTSSTSETVDVTTTPFFPTTIPTTTPYLPIPTPFPFLFPFTTPFFPSPLFTSPFFPSPLITSPFFPSPLITTPLFPPFPSPLITTPLFPPFPFPFPPLTPPIVPVPSTSTPVWSAQLRCKGLDGTIPDQHFLREGRTHRCHHCSALLFKEELSNGNAGRFSKCCSNGDIHLPTIPEVPDPLLRIFRQPTYRAMSRQLNHALAFACWKCHEDRSLRGRYQAISCIRVQGCAYVMVGTIEPEDPTKKLNFIQVFFNSNNEKEAIARTARNAHIDPTRKNLEWLRILHRWIRDNSPIYRVYQQTKDFTP